MGARPVVLLGPQRDLHTVADAVRELGVDGPVATVTAGWEEREAEDAELRDHLVGRAVNLGLWPRAEDVFRSDPEVRALLHERYDRLRALQSVYRLRLAGHLEACRTLFGRTDPRDPDELLGPEIEDAIEDVRALDAHHLGRTAGLDAEILERIGAEERGSIAPHREQLTQRLAGCGAILIAGGHVGILLNRLRLFGVLDLAPELPVVAWSGGAMVLSERVVLFHDSPPQGPGNAEVYAPGLGLVRGVVPLPHANQRLRLDDEARVALFARRFEPDLCAALDGGERLRGSSGGTEWEVSGTRLLSTDGTVRGERVA